MAAIESRSKGLYFAAPWIIGLTVFTLYPFIASIYYSFTDFNVLQPPKWVGLNNYTEIAGDEVFYKVMWNTFKYAAISIPAGLLFSLSLALMMNGVRRGQAVYSIIFYIPHLIPPVVAGILWMWILNPECGLLNSALQPFFDMANGVRKSMNPAATEMWGPPVWLDDPKWAIWSLVGVAMWSVGQTAFIYLAKLQDVPQEMYEAAEIDGATTWQKIRYVTLPMISPIIFFNMVMAIIGSFQVFTEVYVITRGEGGRDRCLTFLPQYIWDNAFTYFRMGYACAMSWILFVIILLLTLLAFRLSKDRVYYAGK
jgi:multiple sugar transport system permease protein